MIGGKGRRRWSNSGMHGIEIMEELQLLIMTRSSYYDVSEWLG